MDRAVRTGPLVVGIVGCLSLAIALAVLAPVAGAFAPTGQGAAADDPGHSRVTAASVPPEDPAQSGSTIVATQRLSLVPENPGRIAVTHQFEIPDGVRSLTTELPADATAVRRDGFRATGGDEFEWTGDTTRPSISFRHAANETTEKEGPIGTSGDRLFVDVGDWALVRPPRLPMSARHVGDVGFSRETRVEGQGATGDVMVYMGPHEVDRRSAHGQDFQLIVPGVADLRESRSALWDSILDASDRLRVGNRDESVFMVAAPTTVPWGVEGLQTGPSDLWVTADERVGAPRNVWLHEYVHSRQSFGDHEESRWLVEGGAYYLAALATFEQDRIDYFTFRNHLVRGNDGRFADVVLSRPGTWVTGANYRKGALAAAAIDRRIRLATDGQRSLQDVWRRMNDAESVSRSAFLGMVGDAGGEDARTLASDLVGTTTAADTWTEEEHRRAFGLPVARFRYALPPLSEADAYRVSGPFRSGSVGGGDRLELVTGETLSVDASVTNDGTADGEYEVSLRVDDRTADATSGTLAAGETVSHALSATVESPGEYALGVGETTVPVRVREPADLRVRDVRANRSAVAPGGAVGLTVDVANEADRPGARALSFERDGDPVATREVRLAGGESASVEVPVRVPGTGGTRLSVGDLSVDVRAVADGGGTGDDAGTDRQSGAGTAGTPDDGGDGFTALGIAVALGLVAALGWYRRRI